MSNVLIEENDLKNIANSIRGKNDSSNKYKVSQMSSAIDLLPKPSGNYNVSENGTYDITNYENVIVSVSGGQITLQSKDVIVTSAGTTTVTADTGYDGLSDVDITLNTETKIVKSTNQSQTITPTTNKFIDEITVEPIVLENISITPSTSSQTITPSQNKDGIHQISVSAVTYTIDNNIIASNIKNGVTILGVNGNVIELQGETKTVKSTTTQQIVTPSQNKNGITEITVQPISLQNKTVTPTSSQQTVTADNGYDGLGTVTVEAGGGSQYVIDYAEIGYDFIPQSDELTGVNYAKQIMQNWDNSITNMKQLYQNNTNLVYFPLVDTSNVSDCSRCFSGCTHLKAVPLLNTSNIMSANRFFDGDSSLVDIPQFDLSSATALYMTFNGCNNLTDESLNNILAICINATAYMQAQAQSNWTLTSIGLSASQKTRCQSLSNWNDFINAGWSA